MRPMGALLIAWWTVAQAPAAPPAGSSVRIDVVAVDQKGKPVMDLRPAEFEVRVSGYQVPITDVFLRTAESTGRVVVLLLDNGAIPPAMAPRVKEAARQFVNLMESGDRVAVAPLHGGGIELTGDRHDLLRAIDAYHVQGFPFRLDDAGEHVLRRVETIARRLTEVADGRKTVVAIGAGWLFDTPLPPPGLRDLQAQWVSAMRTTAATHTSLYVVDPAGLQARRGAQLLGGDSGFARETGGHAFHNTNDIAGAAARIWAEAGTYYVLGMANPPVQRAADLRQVEVTVLRKDVIVRARRGITGRD